MDKTINQSTWINRKVMITMTFDANNYKSVCNSTTNIFNISFDSTQNCKLIIELRKKKNYFGKFEVEMSGGRWPPYPALMLFDFNPSLWVNNS